MADLQRAFSYPYFMRWIELLDKNVRERLQNYWDACCSHRLRHAEADTNDICDEIKAELLRAWEKHGHLNSAHEGYAVLLEEVDELWDHVKMKQSERNMAEMRKEAMQVAAMAIKFLVDICETDNRR